MYRKIKLGKNLTMTDASIMWFLYLKKCGSRAKNRGHVFTVCIHYGL